MGDFATGSITFVVYYIQKNNNNNIRTNNIVKHVTRSLKAVLCFCSRHTACMLLIRWRSKGVVGGPCGEVQNVLVWVAGVCVLWIFDGSLGHCAKN